jgi:hypothetical protein
MVARHAIRIDVRTCMHVVLHNRQGTCWAVVDAVETLWLFWCAHGMLMCMNMYTSTRIHRNQHAYAARRQVALMAGIHLEGEMLGPSDEDEDVFAPQVLNVSQVTSRLLCANIHQDAHVPDTDAHPRSHCNSDVFVSHVHMLYQDI